MNNNSIYSSMVRAGKTAYFVDIREAKNGSKYLSIPENWTDADEKKSLSTIRVFGDSIDQFRQAIDLCRRSEYHKDPSGASLRYLLLKDHRGSPSIGKRKRLWIPGPFPIHARPAQLPLSTG